MDDRFYDLMDRYLDGELDGSARAELQERLAGSPEVRKAFWDEVSRHAMLHEAFQETQGRSIAARETPRRRSRWTRTHSTGRAGMWAAAACALVFAGLVAAALRRPSATPGAVAVERPGPAPSELAPPPGEWPRELPSPEPPVRPAPRPPAPFEQPRDLLPPPEPPVRPAPPPPAPLERPSDRPAPKPPSTVAEPATIIARLEAVEGAVRLIPGGPAQAAGAVSLGQGLETGEGGRATLALIDGTRVEVGGGSTVDEIGEQRLRLRRGELTARVVSRPAAKAMVFLAPMAEARVLGTSLRWTVTETSARLEVTEGKVRLTRLSDGRGVDVAAGFHAVAAPQSDLLPRPLRLATVAQVSFGAGEAPEGFTADVGAAFTPQVGMGWDRDRREATRVRPAGKDLLHRRLIVAGGAREVSRWELAVRNGRYYVSISCGDAQVAQGPNHVAVEGRLVVDQTMTGPGEFVVVEDHPVDVRDGRLTVAVGGHGSAKVDPDGTGDTALNYVIIRRAD